MVNTTGTNFRKTLFWLLEQVIRFNEPVNVSTKNGNVVVLSEDEYNDLVETLYLSSNPVMREKIIDGLNTPLSECVVKTRLIGDVRHQIHQKISQRYTQT